MFWIIKVSGNTLDTGMMKYCFISTDSSRIKQEIKDQIHASYRDKITMCEHRYGNWPWYENSD